MTFSENLQFLRKKSNLSHENLAEKLHITRQAVSKWESGQSIPDAETCIKLCEIFDVSPNRLLLGENEQISYNADNKQTGKSAFAFIAIFLTAVLICGTAMLICNLYNGEIFEPIIHSLSFFMIICSIAAFICISVIYIIINRKNFL